MTSGTVPWSIASTTTSSRRWQTNWCSSGGDHDAAL
jgi:hypothetical protein